jgi:hypothetical protein
MFARLAQWFGTGKHRSVRNARRPRLWIEPLEDRRLLAASVAPWQPLATWPPSGASSPPASSSDFSAALNLIQASAFAQTPGQRGYSPAQLQQAYGFSQLTGLPGNNYNNAGLGETIAIVDPFNDPVIGHDVQQFDEHFNIGGAASDPTSTSFLKVVNQYGGNPQTVLGPSYSFADKEESIDVEWAHAMAPGASILLVEAADFDPADINAAIQYAASQPGVCVVSMSLSTDLESPNEYLNDSVFTTPVGHQGVAFVASSGDYGAQSPLYVPQASPNVLDVGGTTLPADQNGNPNRSVEVGWSRGSDAYAYYYASGGGISQYEAQPAYQQGVVTQSTLYRTSPDVAYDADPSTGVSVYDSLSSPPGEPVAVFGGTSIAAPQWAALIAIADQFRDAAHEASLDGPSQLLPALYQIEQSDPHAFQDITQGNNGYSAGPGYDLVTGLGTPNVQYLVPDLVKIDSSPASPVTVYWTGDAGNNNWDTPGNWSLVDPAHGNVPQSLLPGPANNVMIDLAGATVNHSLTHYDTVRSLTVAAPNVTLNLDSGTLDLSGGGSLGTFQASSSDVVNLTGGVLKSANVSVGTTITVPVSATGLVDGGVLNGTLQGLAGSTLQLQGSWTNNGAITAAAGSTLVLGDYWVASVNDPAATSDAWVNNGTITAAGATVELGGWLTYTSANLNSLSLGTDTVELLGTLDNVNSTLALTKKTGSWYLIGGRIDGGTITGSGGADLIAAISATLDGVTLDCRLDMSAFEANVTIVEGLTLNTDLYLSGYLAQLDFNDGSTLAAGALVKSATVHMTGALSFLWNATSTNVLLNNYPSQTPTIGQGIIIAGGLLNLSGVFGPFDNRGAIEQYGFGTMQLEELDNDGLVAVQSGTVYSDSQPYFGGFFLPGAPWSNNADGTMTTTQNGSLFLDGQWTNSGAITAKGATLNLNDIWTNYGSISADSSSTVSLGDNASFSGITLGPSYIWNNAGTLAIAKGASLNLGDYFTTDEFASGFKDRGVTLNLAQYSITLIGLLDNRPADNPVTAGMLTLNSSTGPLPIDGGEIDGGTLTGTEPLDVSFAALQGVVVDDAINMQGFTNLQIAGTWSITSRGSITAVNSPKFSYFSNLNLSGTWVNNGSITVSGGQSVNLSGTWINNGTITLAPQVGNSLSMPGTWTNYGTITVTAAETVILGDDGGDLTGPGDTWRNAGVLSIAAGSTLYLGGYFTTDEFQSGFADGGSHLNLSQYTVQLFGLLDNSPADNPVSRGTLALNASTGPLYLSYYLFPGHRGIIEQGTITTNGADDLVAAGGELDNVTLDGTMDMSATTAVVYLDNVTLDETLDVSGFGTVVYVTGDLRLDSDLYLSGQHASISVLDGGTVAPGPLVQDATIHLSGSNSQLFADSFGQPATLAPGITVSGESSFCAIYGIEGQLDNLGTIAQNGAGEMTVVGQLLNEGSVTVGNGGTISAESYYGGSFINAGTVTVGKGGTFTMSGADYVQSAGTTTVDGTLVAPNVDLNGGSLTGSGTIQANVINAGTVAPGDTVGTLTIQGNYTQTANGVLLIQIGGANAYGQLAVTGTATLAGTLQVSFVNGYVPAVGTDFEILTFADNVGSFTNEVGLSLPPLHLDPVWHSDSLTLTVDD